MMNVHLLLLTAVLFGCTTVTVQAATTGAFTVEGLIQNGTCDLAAGDIDRTVVMDQVHVNEFDNQSTAGVTTFDLTAHCDTSIKNVTFNFSGVPDTQDSWRFANTGSAKGVALWVYSVNGGATIRANGSDSSRTVPVIEGVALMPLGASYWKVANISPGDFKSRVIVEITYN